MNFQCNHFKQIFNSVHLYYKRMNKLYWQTQNDTTKTKLNFEKKNSNKFGRMNRSNTEIEHSERKKKGHPKFKDAKENSIIK